jgi:hypothetical protein
MKKKEEQLVRKVTDMIQKTRKTALGYSVPDYRVQRSGEETSGNRRGRDLGD